jgi:hypothetical protein
MVCTIHGKHSHFCIGQAQPIHCAMMQLTRAVGLCHVCLVPTNAHLLHPPIERDVVYPVVPVKKRWLSYQRNQPFEEDLCYHFGRLSVNVRALLPSKVPFSNPTKLCGTLCWPPNCRWLVTVLPQGNVELHFDLFFTAYLNGGWWGSAAKLWK